MVGKEIKRVSHGYHYFFVKPGRNSNVHAAAERLMRIEGVREVSITEGEYGFVVKANEIHEGEKEVLDKISRATKGKSARAVCHCRYVKVDA